MDSRTCGLNSCSSRALLECGLSSCGTQASIPCGMWDLPGLGIEPKSHALAGRFLITGPQGKSEVAQSCLTLCDPRDCSLPGSSVHGIFQARVLEWVAISFSRGSSQPRDWALASHIAGKCFIQKAQAFFFFFPIVSLSFSHCVVSDCDTMDCSTPGFLVLPGVCSNSCPLSQWYHPTFSFSVAPFSSCLQSFPASGSFPVCQLFTSGGQSIGAPISGPFSVDFL